MLIYNFCILHEREYGVCVYPPKHIKNNIVYIFGQIIFRAVLFLKLVCLDYILDFFDSGKIRNFVFYMKEHIELVYLLQNRVEKGIVCFF